MNITFLIGNGFDIGLGMPTRYEDFYNLYCQKCKGDSTNILAFKEMLRMRNEEESKKIIDWADFEKAFGEHSSDPAIKGNRDYLERFEDFVEKFNRYLEIVESCTIFDDSTNIAKMMDNAVKAFRNIRKADKDEIDKVYNLSSSLTYNFVSFNYTKSVDSCCRALRDYLQKNKDRGVGQVVHIHGFIEENMIVGVNDPSQIANAAFAEDPEVIREIVKPQQNEVARTAYESALISILNNSTIICIYGMSIGETDKKWWNHIATWLSKNQQRILVILKHTHDYNKRFPHSQDKFIRPLREKFLSCSDLPDSQKKNIESRIYIGINNDVFSMELFDNNAFQEKIKSFIEASTEATVKSEVLV